MAIQDNTKISNFGNRFYRVWTKHNTWYGAKRENRDEKWMTSVLDGLKDSLLIRKNVCISLIHCSKLIKEECLSEGFIVMYSCESSAYIIHSSHWALITSWRGLKYNMNNSGPRTDPCGTPDLRGCGLDSVLPITTF